MASRLQDNKKKTYPEFLRENGMPTDGISVIGFRFPKSNTLPIYHYKIMEAHLGHVLYDNVREKAVVCLPSKVVDEARRIAVELEGVEFSTGLML